MRIFGLIGFPLGHSRSADYFNTRFIREDIPDAHYRLFPIPAIQEFHNLIRMHPQLCGLNVTIPFKEKIIPLLTETDPEAAQIGSVNVVLVDQSGPALQLKGYNTDAAGFLATLPDPVEHRKALVLGTGGASKSVAWALRKAGVEVLFVSRYPHGPDEIGYLTLSESPEIIQEHTLIVNATPAGLFPHPDTCPHIPYQYIGNNHFLYDLVYNPSLTLFLQKGAEKGARIKTGEEMFLKQADLSYSLFIK